MVFKRKAGVRRWLKIHALLANTPFCLSCFSKAKSKLLRAFRFILQKNLLSKLYCKFLLRLNRIHNTWKQIKRVSQRHISLYRTKYTYCHSGFLKRLLSTKSSPHILNKLESRREKWYKRVLNNIWVNSCNITVCGFGKWKLI